MSHANLVCTLWMCNAFFCWFRCCRGWNKDPNYRDESRFFQSCAQGGLFVICFFLWPLLLLAMFIGFLTTGEVGQEE